MFEPQVPESKLYPTDSKEMVGKEEWVAEKAMEVRAMPTLMLEAFVWDGENTGSESLYDTLACWLESQQYFDEMERCNWNDRLRSECQDVAERYAEYVLLPAHIEKMKKGDFDGD